MSESGRLKGRSRVWLSAWVTTAMVLAAGTLLPWFVMATERDDVQASESPLLLAAARQLAHGPRELYGPYGASNPLVLIHPPLYYRLAALCAWPIARAGIDAETAARIAGRTLSLLGWIATLAGAFVLARIPSANDNRGNLAAGAQGVGRPLNDRDRWLVGQIGPALAAKGMLFVGLDVIGGYVTEINVTSPTGIRELDKQFGINIGDLFIQAVERRLAASPRAS